MTITFVCVPEFVVLHMACDTKPPTGARKHVEGSFRSCTNMPVGVIGLNGLNNDIIICLFCMSNKQWYQKG